MIQLAHAHRRQVAKSLAHDAVKDRRRDHRVGFGRRHKVEEVPQHLVALHIPVLADQPCRPVEVVVLHKRVTLQRRRDRQKPFRRHIAKLLLLLHRSIQVQAALPGAAQVAALAEDEDSVKYVASCWQERPCDDHHQTCRSENIQIPGCRGAPTDNGQQRKQQRQRAEAHISAERIAHIWRRAVRAWRQQADTVTKPLCQADAQLIRLGDFQEEPVELVQLIARPHSNCRNREDHQQETADQRQKDKPLVERCCMQFRAAGIMEIKQGHVPLVPAKNDQRRQRNADKLHELFHHIQPSILSTIIRQVCDSAQGNSAFSIVTIC